MAIEHNSVNSDHARFKIFKKNDFDVFSIWTAYGFTELETTASTAVASTDVWTRSGHSFVNGKAVKLSSITTSGGTEQPNLILYVGNVSGNDFKLYSDSGLASLYDVTSNVTNSTITIGTNIQCAYVDSSGVIADDDEIILTAALIGDDGAAGAAGSNGSDGAAGATGATGAAGNDGNDGAAGAQGNTGPTGAAGSDGSDGADAVSYTHLTLPTPPYV